MAVSEKPQIFDHRSLHFYQGLYLVQRQDGGRARRLGRRQGPPPRQPGQFEAAGGVSSPLVRHVPGLSPDAPGRLRAHPVHVDRAPEGPLYPQAARVGQHAGEHRVFQTAADNVGHAGVGRL